MSQPFEMNAWTLGDKDILIDGPEYLSIAVDYDDVPHEDVEHGIEKMVRILNKYWNSED